MSKSKVRVHNEYFMPLVKTTCECGEKRTKVYAHGEYIRARWHTVQHFCQTCFVERVQNQLVTHAGSCGCEFNLTARSGHSIPSWIKMPDICKAA